MSDTNYFKNAPPIPGTIAQVLDESDELSKAKSNANYWMNKCERLQTVLDMLNAPEQTKYTLREYASLDAEGKSKIDDLMSALLAIRRAKP